MHPTTVTLILDDLIKAERAEVNKLKLAIAQKQFSVDLTPILRRHESQFEALRIALDHYLKHTGETP